MKLIRYRKPSMKTMLGVTKAKRKINRSVGLSQMQGWTKPSRLKQKVKYRSGLYSPAAKVVRQTSRGILPSILGFFKSK